jgi:hypothetical protein
MSEKVRLDFNEVEKAMKRAKAARAEYQHRYVTGAFGVVGSKLRARYAIAVIAVLLISFGMKMFFFTSPTAEADVRTLSSASLPLP